MKKYLFPMICALCLAGCDKEEANGPAEGTDQAVGLAGVEAVVQGGLATRAPALDKENYVGRSAFVDGDQMVLTSIKRTMSPIAGFSYKGIVFDHRVDPGQTTGVWNRDEGKGWTEADADQVPERIYWSDASNPHTYVGYSLPLPRETFAWDEVDLVYTGQLRALGTGDAYVDHTSNERIRTDDLLLTYADDKVAETGGSVAKLYFSHALANVRVIVNISSYSASGDAADSKTVVKNMVLKDTPVKYQWNQLSAGVTALPAGQNTTLDTWMWNPRPEGVGTGVGKQFYFYALAVPGKGINQTLTFDVRYPDPMNPSVELTRTYAATCSGLEYRSGHCTTIHVSLSHEDEEITVGAEYMDWQYVESPDQGELQKNPTLLTAAMLERANFTIATDDKANEDDATWLYVSGKDEQGRDVVVDRYGNTGSESKPYLIGTAQQLVSFAYEVKSGRTFEGQYVVLDTDLVLQPELFASAEDQVNWCGVGDEGHVFEGYFLGGGRTIRNLKGSPFFYALGAHAVVERLTFSDVIEVDGRGIVTNENRALIAAVYANGTIRQGKPANKEIYSGSLVGTNHADGGLISCAHVGNVEAWAIGAGAIGGLVGNNQGALVSCYHSGKEKNLAEDGYHTYAGVGEYDRENSYAFSCYFNADADPDKTDYSVLEDGRLCYPLGVTVMQSVKFVESGSPLIDYTGEQWWMNHLSLNLAVKTFCEHVKTGDIPASMRNDSHADWIKRNQDSYLYTYSPGAFPQVR